MNSYTRQQLEEMKMDALIRLFNSCPGVVKVKRFSSRKVAVDRTIEALARRINVRTITSGGKAGRPTLAFSVKANGEGKSSVRASSLRGQIMAHINTLEDKTATITALEQKFGNKVRGAVQKLMAKDWLKRVGDEAAA